MISIILKYLNIAALLIYLLLPEQNIWQAIISFNINGDLHSNGEAPIH